MKISTGAPIGSSVRVGSRWFRVVAHSRDGVTVETFAVDNGRSMAIHCTVIDEVDEMARPRKTDAERAKDKAAKEVNGLLEAVKFCAPGFKDDGELYASHALISHNWISTYNGIIMYGHPIATPLTACPHYGTLLNALKATDGEAVQITQLSPERISVKKKGFKAMVPCVADTSLVLRTPPDPAVGMIDSRMREGFELMKQVTNKRGETVMQASVLIDANIMVACDMRMLVQFYHGINFPKLTVPADFIEAVLKVPKSLVSFGFTPDQSLTFYFEDGSFIRTQLYSEKFPDYERAVPQDWSNVPIVVDGFFDALEKIEPFLPKAQSYVFANDDGFATHDNSEQATEVECLGLRQSPAGLDCERLIMLGKYVKFLDYTHPTKIRFYADNMRGVLTTFVFDRALGTQGHADTFVPPQPEPVEDDDPPVDEPFTTEVVETGPQTVYAGGFARPH